MSKSEAFNMDCMEGMKQYPDKYFDLAVVDPPYGDASSQSLKVERERESRTAWNRFGQRFDRYKQDLLTEQAAGGQGSTIQRTKKLSRGMLPQKKNTLTSFFASHAIKSFGAATTLHFHRHAAF